MKRRRNSKGVMGHNLTSHEYRAYLRLYGYSLAGLGIKPKACGGEKGFFDILKQMFGFEREPMAGFGAEVVRAAHFIEAIPAPMRTRLRTAAKEVFSEARRRDTNRRAVRVALAGHQPDTVPQIKSGYSKGAASDFYRSWDWRTLRMKVLKKYGPQCQCCGSAAGDIAISGAPVRIVVDHIKPLARHWDLRLVEGNLQVLCDECNQGKGAWDETDHRLKLMRQQLTYVIN